MPAKKCANRGAKRRWPELEKDMSEWVFDDLYIYIYRGTRNVQTFLVNSEIENGRHRVYNFTMDTLDPENLLEKIEIVFDSLICAVELNVASNFVLKSVKHGSCRYYYAQEKVTLLERYKLAAITEDSTKIQNLPSNTDVRESCSRDRANTKWKLYKLTKVTICAALLKKSQGCKDFLLLDPLLGNHCVKCLTFKEKVWKLYNDNLCLFRDLALHLHGNKRLEEETSKLNNLFFEKTGRTDPSNFWGGFWKVWQQWRIIFKADIFLYDIDIAQKYVIRELARRSAGQQSSTVRLIRYNSHICYVSNINAFFRT